ncbi:MAG: multi-sensor hybrid histidine kinase [Segetibacter sp.]|jgi:CheY-like chemotaxis protein|nr:multi-sensor hybrid histidine kinase [Segetibacter sp.]
MTLNDFTESFPELRDKLILNVDDNEMNQLVMSKIMQNAGIKIVAAGNGAEAIEKLNAGLKPDAILMDLEMPVMNGIQTSEFIRNRMDPHIPIVVNSGSVSAYEKWKLKRLGIQEFLEKPYSMKDIFSKLSKSIMLLPA